MKPLLRSKTIAAPADKNDIIVPTNDERRLRLAQGARAHHVTIEALKGLSTKVCPCCPQVANGQVLSQHNTTYFEL